MSYAPVYQPGEQCSFYANFKAPIDQNDLNLDAYQLDIVDLNFNAVVGNFTEIKKNVISGSLYHFYAEFLMPEITPGCYRFIVMATGTEVVKYVSNVFTVLSEKELKKTYPVKYRSTGIKNNFYYKNVPSYFNQLRLHLLTYKPEPTEIAKGFNQSDELFYRTISIMKETLQVIAKGFDREAHRAMISMCTHNILFIGEEKLRKGESSSYDINWPDLVFGKADAQIPLEVIDYAEADNEC